MKTYKFAIISIILALVAVLVIAHIFLFWSAYQRTGMAEAPPITIEPQKGHQIYRIPENLIPSAQEIEKRIEKEMAKKPVAEKAAQKILAGKRPPPLVQEITEKPDEKREEKKLEKPLPPKKSVIFPTFEERKEAEKRTGIVAY